MKSEPAQGRRPGPFEHPFSRLWGEGVALEGGANRPFLLHDPGLLWMIAEGTVDLFSVRLGKTGEPVERRHLFCAAAGELVFGVGLGPGERPETLLGVASEGAAIRRVPLGRLLLLLAERLAQGQAAVHLAPPGMPIPAQAASPGTSPALPVLIDRWLTMLSLRATGNPGQRTHAEVRPGEETRLPAGACAGAPAAPVWIVQRSGASHLFGDRATTPIQPGPGSAAFPLASRTWIEAQTEVELLGLDTAAYLERDPQASGILFFHRVVLECLAARRERDREAERDRVRALAEADRAVVSSTLAGLAAVLDSDAPEGRAQRASGAAAAGGPGRLEVLEGEGQPLQEACVRVLGALGVSYEPPAAPDHLEHQKEAQETADPLRRIASAVRMRVRQVVLRAEWWRGDHGPLLAYLGEERRPVALLPTSARSYEIHDVARGTRGPVTGKVAQALAPFAHTFYRRLPDHPLSAPDLVRFGLFGCRKDLLTIAAMGLGSGLLGLVMPLCTAILFDAVIPGAERSQLLQICLGLVLSTVAVALFELASGFAILRVEGKLGATLQAAVWDRLLDLPARFFRRYSAGDLVTRANGIQLIGRSLSTMTVATLMSSAFGVFNAGLLFYYDAHLAWLGMGLVLLAVVVAVGAGVHQLSLQRPLAGMYGHIDGLVFQLINGIAKLRIAGAEGRAFACWASQFAHMRRLALKMRAPLQVFNSFYPLVTAIVIYSAAPRVGPGADLGALSTGHFIAFVVAFESFLSATLSVCQSVLPLLMIRFTYDRLRPILDTLPEVDSGKGDPGELGGEIEISHVSFHYGDGGPLILNDVSLRIRSGEFVAITGASGSGKSTLLRLLLGFERPTTGSVYYSGRDLSGLDVRAVRRQIGAVLQDGKLMADDIFNNIIGSSNLTREEAMEAARMAGFDRDLAQMPMGLHTLVSEGGSTLSGGQRQRLLIARALVRKPRILFFDEATSALDNQTQATVSASIAGLAATRVVIAHRLSTIIHANRIIVLHGGRLVQSGTYEELLRQPGPFAELAKRQLTGGVDAGSDARQDARPETRSDG